MSEETKPSWRDRLKRPAASDDVPPAAPVVTKAAKEKSRMVAGPLLRAMQKGAPSGSNGGRPGVQYGSEEARTSGQTLEQMFPRGPRT
jgi:hypothetical protein